MSRGESPLAVVCIVSGGQTGADRAALDFALDHYLPHGGWCPLGRRAEDGPLDLRYQLVETDSPKYKPRTRRNVEDSDGTVVFTLAREATGGTALTLRLASQLDRPRLHLARDAHHRAGTAAAVREDAERLNRFLIEHQIRRLNVAGPRQSQEPEIRSYVWSVLAAALAGA